MTPKTPEENEEQKLLQYIESHPGFTKSLIGKLLGMMKKGKREKPSLKKSESSRKLMEECRKKRWAKAGLDPSAIAPSTSELPKT